METINLVTHAQQALERGDKHLAHQILSGLVQRNPNKESYWLLMAQAVTTQKQAIACYEKALQINPENTAAQQALRDLQSPQMTYHPTAGIIQKKFSLRDAIPGKRSSQGILMALIVLAAFGVAGFAFAQNAPQSKIAPQLLAGILPPQVESPSLQALGPSIASGTRQQVQANAPQYSEVVDALLLVALQGAEGGMNGAPAQPGEPIEISETAAQQAVAVIKNAIPAPGTSQFVKLTERQVTSWLAMELEKQSDLPLQEVQVYFENGQIKVWGVIQSESQRTSALLISDVLLTEGGAALFKIQSAQVGKIQIPGALLGQVESWLNESLNEQIQSQANGLKFTQVDVTAGILTITAQR